MTRGCNRNGSDVRHNNQIMAMRHHGTLIRWNDERGFGFIAPAGGADELFVHVSAFPRDGRRPETGEVISYLTQAGPDGKVRAISIMRPGANRPPRNVRVQKPRGRRSGWLATLLSLCAIAAIGGVVYTTYVGKQAPEPALSPTHTATQAARQTSRYSCDARQHCSQMRSCEEATYFLRHCPNTKMDGDGDGIPCEQQLCN